MSDNEFVAEPACLKCGARIKIWLFVKLCDQCIDEKLSEQRKNKRKE